MDFLVIKNEQFFENNLPILKSVEKNVNNTLHVMDAFTV